MKKDKIFKAFGNHIRKLRRTSNLTQEEMEDYGFTGRYYQMLEAGTANPSLEIIYKLAKAFKCHPREVIPK